MERQIWVTLILWAYKNTYKESLLKEIFFNYKMTFLSFGDRTKTEKKKKKKKVTFLAKPKHKICFQCQRLQESLWEPKLITSLATLPNICEFIIPIAINLVFV